MNIFKHLLILAAAKFVHLVPVINHESQSRIDFDNCFTMATIHNDAEAQNSLGRFYQHGLGVEENATAAVEWYTKAANQGYAEAQVNLGTLYLEGIGVEKNSTAAVEWFTKAANQGFSQAQFNLGSCYFCGVGVERNPSTSFEWYKRAANQGFAQAQFYLGSCFLDGIVVEQNLTAAVEWYTKVANQGYGIAQFNLGTMYLEGIGVEKNISAAAELFLKAAHDPSFKGKIVAILAKNNMPDLIREIISQRQLLPKVTFGLDEPCSICYEESKDKVIFSPCNHATVCFGCLMGCFENEMLKCPSCNLRIYDLNLLSKSDSDMPDPSDMQPFF